LRFADERIRSLIKRIEENASGFFTRANFFKSTCGLHAAAILR